MDYGALTEELLASLSDKEGFSGKRQLLRHRRIMAGNIGDTDGGNGGRQFHVSRFESDQVYAAAGTQNPIYNWLCPSGGCQSGVVKSGASDNSFTYSMADFGNIPNVTGPNCPSTPCGAVQHIHIADPCVPEGMAGVAGGCP